MRVTTTAPLTRPVTATATATAMATTRAANMCSRRRACGPRGWSRCLYLSPVTGRASVWMRARRGVGDGSAEVCRLLGS